MTMGTPMSMGLERDYPEPSFDVACEAWWVAQDWNGGAGTLTDRVASIVASQSTAGKRPGTTTSSGLTWLTFDGIDDDLYADALMATGVLVSVPTTILMLVYLETAALHSHLWSAGDSTNADNTRQFRWESPSSGTLHSVWSDRSANASIYDHQTDVVGGNVYTIALVDDGTQRSSYINGSKFASDPRNNSPATDDPLDLFTFAANRRMGSESDYCTMWLREASVHSRVFTATDIRLFCAGMRSRARMSPVA